MLERHRLKREARGLESSLDVAAAGSELARIGALEGKDRLLLVADGKDGAHDPVARSGTRCEFRRQPFDDVPLPWAGVLGFVDQDMVDAAIEFEMDPACGDAVEQVVCLVDQVVIVEQAALLLLAAVVRGNGTRDHEQSICAVALHHGAAFRIQLQNARLLGIQSRSERCMQLAERLGHQRFARTGDAFRLG